MENSDNNDERTTALGMPPTSERMTGQSSQNPNIDPQKLKRMLANRRYSKTHHLKQISRIMKLEWTVKCLEGDVERYSGQTYYWKRQSDLFLAEIGELKQKLDFCTLEIESKKAKYVELKKKKEELKKVYVEQRQKYEELMSCNVANAQFMDIDQGGHPTYNFM